MSSIECVWAANALLGEAPFWSVEEGVLHWVDIDGKMVFRYRPEKAGKETFAQDHEIGCIVPRRNGGFVAGLESGLAFLDSNLNKVEFFASPERDLPGTRFNDGKCDRRGRFWVASADRNEAEPLGALYCADGSGRVNRVLSGVIIGNGLGWSPDNRTMYFTDSGYNTIYAFDYDIETGVARNRRIFVEVDEKVGMPDGLTVDADGFVWSAHWGGWRITRYDPAGRIDRVVEMPVPNVTSLAFGGGNLNQLYITTARLGMSARAIFEAPLSGGLFVIEPDVAGLPETVFAG
jgi:sugar lactone lactonase YvrE